MDRRTFIGSVAVGVLAAPLAVTAQPARKNYRIGFLLLSPRDVQVYLIEAFELLRVGQEQIDEYGRHVIFRVVV